jgi:hypothetical protein
VGHLFGSILWEPFHDVHICMYVAVRNTMDTCIASLTKPR